MSPSTTQPIEELERKVNSYVQYLYGCDNQDPEAVKQQVAQYTDALMSLFHKALEAREEEHELGLAEAQLLGFAHGREGYDLESLVSSMGLTSDEWNVMQKSYTLHYLHDADRNEIEANLASDIRHKTKVES